MIHLFLDNLLILGLSLMVIGLTVMWYIALLRKKRLEDALYEAVTELAWTQLVLTSYKTASKRKKESK